MFSIREDSWLDAFPVLKTFHDFDSPPNPDHDKPKMFRERD